MIGEGLPESRSNSVDMWHIKTLIWTQREGLGV
jgi:hypothetical protein